MIKILIHTTGALSFYILIVYVLEFIIKVPTQFIDEGLTKTPLFLISICIYLLILIRLNK